MCLFVCLSVFSHNISKTDAAGITKLDAEMSHDESWKPIYFGVKMSKFKVTRTLPAWVLTLLRLLASFTCSCLEYYATERLSL